MKCLKCKKVNNDNVSYCYNCGNKFTDKEKEKAKKQGIGGFLRFLIKIKDTYTLSFITGKMWFRVLSVLLVLAIGVFNIVKNGTKFRILNSDNYSYEYNQKLKEYYLYVNENETPLSLYIPGSVDNVGIEYYDENNNLIEKKNYNKDENIVVKTNLESDNYYILVCNKSNIKLRVYNQN